MQIPRNTLLKGSGGEFASFRNHSLQIIHYCSSHIILIGTQILFRVFLRDVLFDKEVVKV